MAFRRTNRVVQQLRTAVLRDGAGPTDGQLLERFVAQRDEAAFEALLLRHGPMVHGVCRRVLRHEQDAEDAFQAAFLVLARKAAAVVPRERVGNWLYGVACHTARKARAAALKRRARERPATAAPEPEAAPPDPWAELRPLLDQELSRLPDKYRAPVLLCDLEGRTQKEAARQLGWPEGTVAGRLARARALLAKRLVRRGLVLSAGAVASLLAEQTASASVPTLLASSTVRAVALVAAGQAAAGAVSAEAAALAEGVMRSMFLNKVSKVTAVVLAVVILATGTGLILSTSQARGPDAPEKKKEEKRAEPPAAAAGEPKAPTGAVAAAEVGGAFRTNEALADEKFRGKRVVVTGWVLRIKRGGRDAKERFYYDLIMGSKERAELKPGHFLVNLEPETVLSFRFSEDHRKDLAELKQGQQVTVEGLCDRSLPKDPGGQPPDTVYFEDCKIIKVEN